MISDTKKNDFSPFGQSNVIKLPLDIIPCSEILDQRTGNSCPFVNVLTRNRDFHN